MKRKNRVGQSVVSYAVLIAIVAGALITTKVFMVRVMQDKFRQSADVFGQGEQYQRGVTVVTSSDAPPVAPQPPVAGGTACTDVVSTVADLEHQAADLLARAEALEQSANDAEAPLLALQAQAADLTAQIQDKQQQAVRLRGIASDLTAQCDQKQARLDQLKADYPGCFDFWSGFPACPPETGNEINELQGFISAIRPQADSYNSQAAGLEQEITGLQRQLQPINITISQTQGITGPQCQAMRTEATNLRNTANEKQAQANQSRSAHPACF